MPSLDEQQHIDLREAYKAALEDMKPGEHEEMPGIDTPWSVPSMLVSSCNSLITCRYWEYTRRNNGYTDPFPGTLHFAQSW